MLVDTVQVMLIAEFNMRQYIDVVEYTLSLIYFTTQQRTLLSTDLSYVIPSARRYSLIAQLLKRVLMRGADDLKHINLVHHKTIWLGQLLNRSVLLIHILEKTPACIDPLNAMLDSIADIFRYLLLSGIDGNCYKMQKHSFKLLFQSLYKSQFNQFSSSESGVIKSAFGFFADVFVIAFARICIAQ